VNFWFPCGERAVIWQHGANISETDTKGHWCWACGDYKSLPFLSGISEQEYKERVHRAKKDERRELINGKKRSFPRRVFRRVCFPILLLIRQEVKAQNADLKRKKKELKERLRGEFGAE
jgi:hypothetical protein